VERIPKGQRFELLLALHIPVGISPLDGIAHPSTPKPCDASFAAQRINSKARPVNNHRDRRIHDRGNKHLKPLSSFATGGNRKLAVRWPVLNYCRPAREH
jgi:hypothetical protein